MKRRLTSSLLLLCAILQVLDGTLTAIGLSILPEGIHAEGNPIVKYILMQVGVLPGLFILKGTAVAVLLYINNTMSKLPPWKFLTIMCIVINLAYLYAVGGWAYLFISRYFNL